VVPQPSFAGNDRIRDLENYGYAQGTFLGNPRQTHQKKAKDRRVIRRLRRLSQIFGF